VKYNLPTNFFLILSPPKGRQNFRSSGSWYSLVYDTVSEGIVIGHDRGVINTADHSTAVSITPLPSIQQCSIQSYRICRKSSIIPSHIRIRGPDGVVWWRTRESLWTWSFYLFRIIDAIFLNVPKVGVSPQKTKNMSLTAFNCGFRYIGICYK
jgi:hypothetical protein